MNTVRITAATSSFLLPMSRKQLLPGEVFFNLVNNNSVPSGLV
jgi:hypothetical protein